MTEALTGRTRYRPHRSVLGRVLLVLKAEVRASFLFRHDSGAYGSETVTRLEWRDARVTDTFQLWSNPMLDGVR